MPLISRELKPFIKREEKQETAGSSRGSCNYESYISSTTAILPYVFRIQLVFYTHLHDHHSPSLFLPFWIHHLIIFGFHFITCTQIRLSDRLCIFSNRTCHGNFVPLKILVQDQWTLSAMTSQIKMAAIVGGLCTVSDGKD